jgi:hypothetical protein
MIRADMQPALPGFRPLKAAWVTRCPHLILTPEHYRTDGSCRCDDPSHPMDTWGYRWDGRARRWLDRDEAEHYRRRQRRSWLGWLRRR